MPKQIIIAEQHRIGAVFGEDQIQELVVATGQHQVSDIYLGTVENVLPGIDAAFVNIGDPARNGFIHVSDLGPLRLRRSSGSITELLAPQQKVLVQIMKEPTGNKGPRLTGNVSLPGRYVVLIPFGKGVNLSRRIRSESERNRLRALAILAKPEGMGLLVRTEAENTNEDAILEDLEQLQRQWEGILKAASTTRAPALLNRDDDFIQRVLRDMYSQDVNRIVVDSPHGLKRVKQTLQGWNDGQIPAGVVVDQHRERQPILEYFRVNAAIRESLKPRVDLPSGGYIIIQPTEALTVIDVNSGSFTRSSSSRETVLWTNCEAATEIARQLRLRNIAGVIVVDFIDMDYRKDRLQVLENFNKQLRADKARPQIAQLSELGLVELTRKRQGQNIYELFGSTCPTCGGLGHLAHVPGEEVYDANGEPVPVALVTAAPTRERRGSDRPISGRTLHRSGRRHERMLGDDRASQPESTWDNFDGENGDRAAFPVGNRDDDFNLVNHPSYQQQNGLGKKRRRRMGRGDSQGTLREREDLRGIGKPTNSIGERRSLNNRGISSGEDRTRPTLVSRDFTPPEIEAYVPDEIEAEFIDDLSPGREAFAAGERERPGKPQRLKPTRPTLEPPEVVTIEMSDLEKETYAWMGVSPLVKVGRELNNPKTAIVTVVPIGSLPPEERVAAAAAVAAPPAPEPIDLDLDRLSAADLDRDFAIPMADEARISPPAEVIVGAAAVKENREPEPLVEAAAPPEAEAESAIEEVPETRRRRKRSSAAVET